MIQHTMLALQLLATIALIAALLLTFLLGMATSFFTARPPTGPDTMGLAGLFFGMGARWILMLAAALLCVGLGHFDWISAKPGVPTLTVIAVFIGLGVVIAISWMQWAGRSSWFKVPAGNLGGIALPVLINLYLLAMLWSRRTETGALESGLSWPRHVGLPLAVISAVGLAIGGFMLVSWKVARLKAAQAAYEHDLKWHEDNNRENQEREARQAKELDELSDDAPLKTFVTHLFIDKSDAHHVRAIARINALPKLTERLDREMLDPDPLQREYIANYMRHSGAIDPAWAGILRRHMRTLADDVRAAPALYDPPTQRTYKGMIWGSLLTARCFPAERFEAEVREIRAAVESKNGDPTRESALELIDKYLAGQPMD